MSWPHHLHLIPLFNFYLALVFLVSTFLRFRQYRAMLNLVRRGPGRWPNLLVLVRRHANIFLTWGTVGSLVTALGLLLINTLASRLVWPTANHFTLADLLEAWPAVPVVLLTGLAMIGFDAYATWNVGELGEKELEGYFDQAEYWLGSWKAPVVRWLSLGYVNPRQMVDKEVRAALESASEMLGNTLRWVAAQAGLRIAFGLSLWTSWALHGWLLALVHGA
jgi:hypothetical protein